MNLIRRLFLMRQIDHKATFPCWTVLNQHCWWPDIIWPPGTIKRGGWHCREAGWEIEIWYLKKKKCKAIDGTSRIQGIPNQVTLLAQLRTHIHTHTKYFGSPSKILYYFSKVQSCEKVHANTQSRIFVPFPITDWSEWRKIHIFKFWFLFGNRWNFHAVQTFT